MYYRKITLSLLLITLLSAISPVSAQETGIQLHSLRNQMSTDLPAAIKQIEKWGIRYVEGTENLYGRSVEEFKSLLDHHNIRVVSVDTSYEEVRDNPYAIVYKAKFYGAKYATFYWIPHDSKEGFRLQEANAAIEIMNRAGEILTANGITLQYHPHGYEFSSHEDGTLLDHMLQNVKNAKFQMDVFWIKQGGQDPEAYLNKYPKMFATMHMKDRKHGTLATSNGKADIDSNVSLGTGDVGISNLVNIAREQGIKYLFIEDESSRVLEQVPKSIDYLKSLSQ